MRISPDPLLPREGANDFTRLLLARLNDVLRAAANQINSLSEGRISAVTNAYTAAPTAGKWTQGDFIRNSAPSELGSVSSKYVILGWVCTTGGEPGTWKEVRTLTGN